MRKHGRKIHVTWSVILPESLQISPVMKKLTCASNVHQVLGVSEVRQHTTYWEIGSRVRLSSNTVTQDKENKEHSSPGKMEKVKYDIKRSSCGLQCHEAGGRDLTAAFTYFALTQSSRKSVPYQDKWGKYFAGPTLALIFLKFERKLQKNELAQRLVSLRLSRRADGEGLATGIGNKPVSDR